MQDRLTNGKVLHLHLPSGKSEILPAGAEDLRLYLGGAGWAAHWYYRNYEEIPEPLAPDSPLLVMAGLLSGTIIPTAAFAFFCGRSPRSGLWNECAMGGHFGSELHSTGYEGLIVTGKADEPVVLFINEAGVTIIHAKDLWGLDAFHTVDAVRPITNQRAQVAAIGHAGETQSLMAGIVCDGKKSRVAARGGMGAIMGSKNIKAIAVRGEQRPRVAMLDALQISMRTNAQFIREGTQQLYNFGTSWILETNERQGGLAIKNWQEGAWVEGAHRTGGQALADSLLANHHACFACPIRCIKSIKAEEGPYPGMEGYGPEYETNVAFGALCGNVDLGVIAAANHVCNRHGVDTSAAGATVAFAMEAYERGLIGKEDTGGLELHWGDGQAILKLLHLMINRQGVGELLADGVASAAAKLGDRAAEFAVVHRGMEVPGHDPRAYPSLMLTYATANRGPDHIDSLSHLVESGLLEMPDMGYQGRMERFTEVGKAKLTFDMQNYLSVYNSLGLCKFLVMGGVGPRLVAEWLNHATGWGNSVTDLLRSGERIFNIKRLFNVRLGVSRKDDLRLPPRLIGSTRPSGTAQGQMPNLGKMLAEYYKLRGWDEEGLPTRDRQENLEIIKVIKEDRPTVF